MAVDLPELAAIMRDALGDQDLDLTLATRFEDITGWDSMVLVTVVVEVECRCDIQFDPAELDRLVSVDDLLRMIAAKRAPARV